MKYWKVNWYHDFPEEPVVLYSEIGTDGYEERKVEEFRDGKLSWADESQSFGGAVLSEIPVGPIEDVQAQPDFAAHEITKNEFEVMWDRARKCNSPSPNR